MSQYRGLKLRQRDQSTFDPTDRIASMLWWGQVERGLVTSGGNFAQLTDLSGGGHHGLPVAGKNLPAIIPVDSALGNKPSIGFSKDGVGQPVLVAGVVLHTPFTVYMAAYMGSDVGVIQLLFDGTTSPVGNYPRMYTYAGGPPDSLVMFGSSQLLSGVVLASSPFALAAVFDNSGSQSGVSKNSETLDATADLGSVGSTGFVIGIDRAYTAAWALDGRLAEMIIVSGRDTKAQQRDMLGYFQGRYSMAIDFDPQGTIYRQKLAINLSSTPSAYPSLPLSSLVSSAGEMRIHERYSPGSANAGHAEVIWAQHNSGAGPEVLRNSDGTITVRSGSVAYTSEMTFAVDTLHDCEIFAAVGGGVVPELAFRFDGVGGAWIPIPLPGAGTFAAIPATGSANIGGDPSGNSVLGTLKELVSFVDGAGPSGYLKRTPPTGVLAVIGGGQAVPGLGGSWLPLALRDTTKNYPIPRMLGALASTAYEDLLTNFATYNALLVGGSTRNIVVIAGGGLGSIFTLGHTPAAAFSALQSLCSAFRSAGWNKIIVMTMLPTSLVTNADRATLNASITGAGFVGTYADAVVNWGADATIGGASAYTNTTYYQSGQIGLMLAGGRIAGALAATAFNAVIP